MIDEVVVTGANYGAIAVPFDNPTKYATWVASLRAKGLKIWHRGHWNAWEGENSVGAVTSITRSSSTATVTTATAHGMSTGDTVSIKGASQSEYNGEFTITVTSSTTFTYTVSGSPATPATGTIKWRYGRYTYRRKTQQFITDNPTLFRPGDLFGMCVESSNAHDHDNNTFVTASSFDMAKYNQFLIDQVYYANQSFKSIGLEKQIHTWAIS